MTVLPIYSPPWSIECTWTENYAFSVHLVKDKLLSRLLRTCTVTGSKSPLYERGSHPYPLLALCSLIHFDLVINISSPNVTLRFPCHCSWTQHGSTGTDGRCASVCLFANLQRNTRLIPYNVKKETSFLWRAYSRVVLGLYNALHSTGRMLLLCGSLRIFEDYRGCGSAIDDSRRQPPERYLSL